MKEEISVLQDHFLIAMPSLDDYNFHQAVIYVCAHNEEGTMGIVVNRPIIDINLGEVLVQMNIQTGINKINKLPVYLGGPVQPERGFIIHQPNDVWQSTLITSNDIGVTSSQDILQAMASGEGPEDAIVILGYSGWGAGQLELEIAANYWLTVPADPRILFETPYDQRWEKSLAMIGVEPDSLSNDIGHA